MDVHGSLVFAGDSVTDCGRREDPAGLGSGYVRELASTLVPRGVRVANAGVGGDRLADLGDRWEADVVARHPDHVSVLIGINDTWRLHDTGERSDHGAFAERYRLLLSALPSTTRIVLLEPFVLPVTEDQERWRDDLDPRIEVVHLLAEEFGAVLVPIDAVLHRLARRLGAPALAADGVHPTERGHREIAAAWSRTVGAA